MPVPAAAAVALKAKAGADGARRAKAAIGAVVSAVVVLPVFMIIFIAGGSPPPVMASGALADIPTEALAAYNDAATRWDVHWSILAAIGKVECDHGRAQLAGCNPPDTINEAGARGYMQFIGSTWRRGLGQYELEARTSPPAADGQGYATDGDGDGTADPWSWPDAAHSAARYLAANNVAGDPKRAIWHYNHSSDYVDQVVQIAEGYHQAATTAAGNTDVAFTGEIGAGGCATPAKGTVTSGFGQRWGRLHAGIDIAAPIGTPIWASKAGTVTFAGWQNGYGNTVIVDHGGGMTTLYAHQNQIVARSGMAVAQGQLIGYVGSTGKSTGPHLHFETRYGGSPRDPRGCL